MSYYDRVMAVMLDGQIHDVPALSKALGIPRNSVNKALCNAARWDIVEQVGTATTANNQPINLWQLKGRLPHDRI